jgi:rhodanese-related sulfurtransferase
MPVEELHQISAQQLHDSVSAGRPMRVLDIRDEDEWNSGHVPGSVHVQGGELAEDLAGVPDGTGPLVVMCRSGYRSTAVSSTLRRKGIEGILNLTGGMLGWRAAGLPVE